MSKKRRKGKARAGYRTPTPVVSELKKEPGRTEVPPFLGWLSRGSGESAWPSIPRSIGRGMIAVGSSPPLLLVPFLFVFGAWVGMVGLGMEGPAGRLVNLAALPPISTYFDALNGVTIYGYGAPGLAAAAGFLVIRAAFVAVVTGLAVQTLEGAGSAVDGVRRGLRAFPIVLAVNILTMSMMITGTVVLPFLGPGFGFLGSVLILVAALFLFAFAPTAAIRERRNLQETLRRSARAALMPGSRHVLMSMLYIFLTLPLLVAFAPGGNQLTVNPGLATWIYALGATFVNTSFLVAFAYRWMAIEPKVPEQPVQRRRR